MAFSEPEECDHHLDVDQTYAACGQYKYGRVFQHMVTISEGQIFSLFHAAVAAAEATIGLAILVVFFRSRGSIAVEDVNMLKGKAAHVFLIVFLPLMGSVIAGLFSHGNRDRATELVTVSALMLSLLFFRS